MHGGDIYSTKVKIDFSVNVNPLGIKKDIKKSYYNAFKYLTSYPDITNAEQIKNIANHLSINSDYIILGNGASELFFSILKGLNVKTVLLLAPCFTGYERAIDAVDAKIEYIYLKKENQFEVDSNIINEINKRIENTKIDSIIITNPNNPTGKVINQDYLSKIADICKINNIALIIDECFIDLCINKNTSSMIKYIKDYDNIIIVNAFTKTYAIPGIRLGYCICKNDEIKNKIKKQIPEWNISIPAQFIAKNILKDKNYLYKTKKIITKEKLYLSTQLSSLGFEIIDSDVNFILFYDKNKKRNLKTELLKCKILLRDCSDYEGLEKGFYRIAIRKHSENQVLIKKLRKIIYE